MGEVRGGLFRGPMLLRLHVLKGSIPTCLQVSFLAAFIRLVPGYLESVMACEQFVSGTEVSSMFDDNFLIRFMYYIPSTGPKD